MPSYTQKVFISLALYPIYSSAVEFPQCFADVTSCANSTGCTLNISNTTALSILRTSNGSPVSSVDTATAFTYAGCVAYCGTGEQTSGWTVFSEGYSSWLLPYFALLSQLPFGAKRRTDNLMSVVLTLGSPTLAGYSLFVTLLNARWVNEHLFSGIDFPNAAVRKSVVQVLSGLQQVPIRVHPGDSARFESLVVHPDNDQWWTVLAKELDYTHGTWSIASATSITWVVIAYLLTITDSLSNVTNIGFNGQAIGSGLLWLLPVVVGWLIISPKSDYFRVHEAYQKANGKAFVADPDDPASPPTHVTSGFGLTIDPSPDWVSYGKNITSPDESRIPPVFNYARTLSWSRNAYLASLFYRAAWRRASKHVGVNGGHIPDSDAKDGVPRENRLGTRDQVVRYCRPYDWECSGAQALWPPGVLFNMIVASLLSLQLQWGTTGAAILMNWYTPTVGLGCRSLAFVIYGVVSTAAWVLLIASSTVGYYAHHLADDPPTLDPERVERRALLRTASASHTSTRMDGFEDDASGASCGENGVSIPLHTIQAPYGKTVDAGADAPPDTASEPEEYARIKSRRTEWRRARLLARLADCLRWMGKTIATINAIGVVANSIFQFTGVYSNCYCPSSVFTRGSQAFYVVNPTPSDLALTTRAWLGGLGLTLACCAFSVGCIYLVRDTLPS